MSRCDCDLWPVDLLRLWHIKRHVIKVCRKFEWNWAIPGWSIDDFRNFCTHYVTLWPWLWPLTLGFYSTSGVMHLNSVQNLSEIEWSTVELLTIYARFRRAFSVVRHFCPMVLMGACSQLHQTWRGHGAIIPTQEICFSVRLSSCIFKLEQLKI